MKPRIYIVEDAPDLRFLISTYLENEGYEVKAVHDPAQINPQPGDVVLTDCEIWPYQPRFEWGDGIKVVVMSANRDYKPHLNKPFTLEQLISAIEH